jgi:hypothetical protein
VLEAAHIIPYRGIPTNHPQNGLLLRADVHTLFDIGLISIDTRTMTVLVSEKVRDSSYASMAGIALTLPADPGVRPSIEALDRHRERSGLSPRTLDLER